LRAKTRGIAAGLSLADGSRAALPPGLSIKRTALGY
jgi:hypothetical protein